MDDKTFFPFYERMIHSFPGYIVGEVLFSLFLGLAFIAMHYLSIDNLVFKDWSWFLGVLITTAMLCVYYATYTLKAILPEMKIRLTSADDGAFMRPILTILSDRNFFLAGFFFGVLNCGFGISFGLPYIKNGMGPAIFTILCGYFLAGVVCGMAVLGIYGVSVSIPGFIREAKGSLDFTSPDRCGGTLFLGEALIVFGSVTLIVGVMISVYILKTNWTGGHPWLIIAFKCFWIAFPYLMSLIVLIAPAVPINKALRDYKMDQEVLLKNKLKKISKNLENDQIETADRKDLREDYEFLQRARKNLHSMRTWPYGLGANLKYLTVFLSSSWASFESVSKWVKEFFPR